MQARDLTLNDINVGDEAFFSRTWEEKDIELFAQVSGNYNPLHVDEEYAKTTKFGSRIIFGMHLAVVCSTLVGMYLPGKRCLCLRQDLQFKNPVYIGDTVMVKGVVTQKSESTSLLTISIEIKNKEEVAALGTMIVQVL